jgi:hypothetical protein
MSLFRAVWLSSSGLLLLLCVLLVVRRIAGGLQHPLPSVGLVAVGLLAAIMTTGLRILAENTGEANESIWKRWSWRLLPTIGLLCFAIGLTLPGSSAWGLAIFWGILALEEGVWWFRDLRGLQGSRQTAGRERRELAQREGRSQVEISRTTGPDWADALPSEMTQHVTRRWTANGGEIISGFVRGDFQPGERTQNLHLSFCPPLASRPALETHQLEGPTARIKAAEIESYGARLEIRLTSRISHPESVVVQFEATVPGA